MKILKYLFLLMTAGSVAAAEVEIGFRYQPVDSDAEVYVQHIRAEENGGEISAEIGQSDRRQNTSISTPEFDQLILTLQESIGRFEFDTGLEISPPYIEVVLSFTGRDHSIEVKEVYAEGDTPFQYVQLQQRYFQQILQ